MFYKVDMLCNVMMLPFMIASPVHSSKGVPGNELKSVK
jgi:hypothetical protein